MNILKKKKNPITRVNLGNEYSYIEKELREKFGTKVKVTDKKLEINFTDASDLDRILEIMGIKLD